MNDTTLKDRRIWITGASSGIGEALAVQASAAGAYLVLSARREAELERVRGLCANPERVAVLPLDLTDFDAGEALRRAEAAFGPIDILVNNAGISQRGTVLQTQESVYRRIFELDFFACVKLTQAVLPGMVQRRQGHIVTVSSVVGYVGTPLRSGYAAAKHALHGFYEALRAEVWREGVQITLVCPGYIRTQVSVNAVTADGGQHGKMDEGQLKGLSAEACAARIWKAVRRGEAEVLIGAKEAVFVYLRRWFPGLLRYALKRAKVT
jgi:short-subunit dehydrogenase